MPSETAEIVRQLNHALRDGDVDVVAALCHQDITWRAIAPSDSEEMSGLDSVRRYVQGWLDTFENLSVFSEELLEVGDEHVVAVQRTTGRARLSGLQTDLTYALVYTVRESKIACVREYRRRTEALNAVGLAV